MKVALCAAAFAVILVSCQKDISSPGSSITSSIASEALTPLPCHALTFSTNYGIINKIPPFSFTKTQYADSRIRTVNYLHRVHPNSKYYEPQEYLSYKGTVTYGPNVAYISSNVEHFIPAQSLQPIQTFKRNVIVRFNENGHALGVFFNAGTAELPLIKFTYSGKKMTSIVLGGPHYEIGYAGYETNLLLTHDSYGNVTRIKSSKMSNGSTMELNYTYNYAVSNKNYMYQPSQYVISPWYSMLELMEWIPKSIHERKTIVLKIESSYFDYTLNKSVPFVINQGVSNT